jgi:hypothetical protein
LTFPPGTFCITESGRNLRQLRLKFFTRLSTTEWSEIKGLPITHMKTLHSIIAPLCQNILHNTVTHTTSSAARNVFASSCLVTASNSGYSFTSGLKSSLNGGSLSTELFLLELSSFHRLLTEHSRTELTRLPRHGPSRKQFPAVRQLHVYPWVRVYRAVALKRLWYIWLSPCRCMVTAVHATMWKMDYAVCEFCIRSSK